MFEDFVLTFIANQFKQKFDQHIQYYLAKVLNQYGYDFMGM